MPYKPFPISNLRTGKLLGLEPWLYPKDALETLKNGYLRYGVLQKRRGYELYGQMVHVDTSTKAPVMSTDPIMGIHTYQDGDTKHYLIMDKARVNKYLTSITKNKTLTAFAQSSTKTTVTSAAHGFTDDEIVTISDTTSYDGTYKVESAATDTFVIAQTFVADDATGTATQEQYIDLTKNKIRFKHASKQNWSPSVGDTVYGGTSHATGDVEEIIVDTGALADNDANGTIIFSNGTGTGTFVTGEELQESGAGANIIGEADGAATDDEFTGDSTNFFSLANCKGKTYFSNDYGVIQKYNGTNLSRFPIDLDVEGGPDNDVTRCRFIIYHKTRLIILDTTERGTRYRPRARWCEAKDYVTWKDDSYVDADTEEMLIAYKFLGDDIVVWFENSTWLLSYTSDSDLPYRWDKIDAMKGCYARMSPVAFSDEVMALGKVEISATDGREAYAIDKRIPDFSLTWIQNSVPFSYGYNYDELKQAWITYASAEAIAHADGNIYPNRVLVLNVEDKSFSTLELPVHVLGQTVLEADLTWDDIYETWDEIDWTWDRKDLQAGYPITLMGGEDGKIYKLNSGGDDDGSDIEFQAIFGQWNPFIEDGKKALLGWLDFLVDVDANVSFTVKNYIDTDLNPVHTELVSCTAVEGSEEVATHRVYVNAMARFHRLEIYNNDSVNRPVIHAIIPYMEAGGDIL